MNDKELLEAIRTIVREEVERAVRKYTTEHELRKDFGGQPYWAPVIGRQDPKN